ncbi:MAG TPA: haloalkane dehalogenase [Leptospiraceae bacterium]|nr:haloalkane dehalogenase [Leptospiraceae bacterium]HMY69500.1 haloalkane dehalogenase [Leptospiraceae bacterium]HNF12580.1 haloalkane dehalogenase [Leptospiraceae bacterium]HNF25399.1 haloalkane dehalogenase [Leptospiraceae bacterium]HNI25526.1 haloalkane dehalogenase [Leptospiraceae bacterium]
MEFLRTPEEQFLNLEGYSFSPNYVNVSENGMRMHYVEEGNRNGETILLMHGEPSWSYLYRKMIPPLAEKGFRVIAPDLIGFGKSDKPASQDNYTYQAHMDWLDVFLKTLDLQNITLFCQDWGGLLGLRLASLNEERFSRIAAGNTFLPTGEGKPAQAFLDWRNFSQNVKRLPVGKIIQNGCVSSLSSEVLKGYNAPFPSEEYKAGARKFPLLVPISPDDPEGIKNKQAWEVFRRWKKPFLTAFSDSDPITAKADIFFKRAVPGAKGQKHAAILGAGHFLQEDKGEELAQVILDFIGSR